jgi:hypothetical protein
MARLTSIAVSLSRYDDPIPAGGAAPTDPPPGASYFLSRSTPFRFTAREDGVDPDRLNVKCVTRRHVLHSYASGRTRARGRREDAAI